MTIKELRKFAKVCNVRLEEHQIVEEGESYYNPFSKKWVTPKWVQGYEIGLNNITGRIGTADWQWVWFYTWKEEVNEDTEMFFRHRYSMNNGKAYKSCTEAFRAEQIIRRRMAENKNNIKTEGNCKCHIHNEGF